MPTLRMRSEEGGRGQPGRARLPLVLTIVKQIPNYREKIFGPADGTTSPPRSPPQRVLRAAVGTLGPAALLDRQINPWMGVPQVHLRHGAAERQVLDGDVVLVLGVGFYQGPGRRRHGVRR